MSSSPPPPPATPPSPLIVKGATPFQTARTAAAWKAWPAALLGDTVASVPAHAGRSLLRLLVVLCVITVVIGLTIAKYTTDDSLRSSVFIERKTSGITPEDANSGICPCTRQWLPWGYFVAPREPARTQLAANASDYLRAQCASLFDTGRATIIDSVPTNPSNTSVLFSASRQYARAAAINLCLQTMLQIIPSLQNVTDTDTFTSPFLQDVQGTEAAYRIYVGNTVISQLRASLLAYDALTTVAVAIESAASCANSTEGAQCVDEGVVASLTGANEVAIASVATGQAALMEVSTNILNTFGSVDAPNNDNTTASGLVRELVTALGIVNWEAYKRVCNPIYCDVFTKKNTVTRVTEFLAVVGGLWQSCLFGGLIAWLLIGFVARIEDHTYVF